MERLSRYEIVRVVGRGGSAVVYEARDASLDRSVALKVVLPGRGNVIERLRREATATANLRHPNIVTVHEIGSADGQDFIAMDFVAGGTLAEARHRMSPDERMRAIETVARAVGFAHEHGVTHRDLKPQNVLVEAATGRLFLTDFGLAKVDSLESLTRTGSSLGTPFYMAPEQVLGDGPSIGPATDAWALGVMLHEMIAGRPPFQGATDADLFEQIQWAEPPKLKEASADLRTICAKAMDKEPGRRYRNGTEFADDLHRVIDGEPIAARPPSPLRRAWRRIRRNALVWSLAFALLVALGVLAGIDANRRARDRADARRHAGNAERILATLPAERAASIDALIRADDQARRAGDPNLRYRVNRLLGDRALDQNDFSLARVAFTTCRNLRPSEDLEPRVLEREKAEERRRRDRIGAVIEDLHQGLGRANRPRGAPLLEDFVFECVQYNDEQTVSLLAGALGPLLDRAGETERWKEDERTLMQFCFRVLGRLGRASCVDALAAFMQRLIDPLLAAECGKALCNTRRPEATGPMLAAGRRFGTNSPLWRQLGPLLPRLPEFGSPVDALDAAALLDQAVNRMSLRDFQGALKDCNRALELDPGNAMIIFNRGRARYHLGDPAGACADYDLVIRIDPRNTLGFTNRGLARQLLGNTKGALDDWNSVLAIDPDEPVALNNRAVHRKRTADFAGAIDDLTRLLRLDPRNWGALYNRGSVYGDMNDHRRAIEDYTAVLEIDPANVAALCDRGGQRGRAGELDLGMADVNCALELDPRHVPALLNRAMIHDFRGNSENALDDSRRATAIDAKNAIAWFVCGGLRVRKKDFDGAIADFTRAIDIEPGYVAALLSRATALNEKSDVRGALADWKRALEIQPEHPEARAIRDAVAQAEAILR